MNFRFCTAIEYSLSSKSPIFRVIRFQQELCFQLMAEGVFFSLFPLTAIPCLLRLTASHMSKTHYQEMLNDLSKYPAQLIIYAFFASRLQ